MAIKQKSGPRFFLDMGWIVQPRLLFSWNLWLREKEADAEQVQVQGSHNR